jgi:hypothetical protein
MTTSNTTTPERTPRDDEQEYFQILLQVLATGPTKSVELSEERPAPSLSMLANGNPELVSWVNGQQIRYDRVGTGKVIRLIKYHAGFRWYKFRLTTGAIHTIVLDKDDSPHEWLFVVRRLKAADGGQRISVLAYKEVKDSELLRKAEHVSAILKSQGRESS